MTRGLSLSLSLSLCWVFTVSLFNLWASILHLSKTKIVDDYINESGITKVTTPATTGSPPTQFHKNRTNSNPDPSQVGLLLFEDAVDECNSIKTDIGYYPSMMRYLLEDLRNFKYWEDYDNIFRMANAKLGDKVYASKVGVRSPEIYFCGRARDLPRNIKEEFGDDFVLKPVFGKNAEGVKVIWNGQDRLAKNQRLEQEASLLSYDSLIEEYGSETYLIAEELVESANPNLKGLVPPDYKFFSYSSQAIEDVNYVDRNNIISNNNDSKNTTGRTVHNCGNQLQIHYDSINDEYAFEPLKNRFFPRQKPCDLDGSDGEYDDGNGLMLGLEEEEVEGRTGNHRDKTREMMKAVKRLSKYFNDNYMRIDMFDSSKGPMLGEFTPVSARGNHVAFSGCVHTYLFIHHAMKSEVSDDAQLILRHLINHPQEITFYRPKIHDDIGGNKQHLTLIRQALRERILRWIPSNWKNITLGGFNGDIINSHIINNHRRRPKPPRDLQAIADGWFNFTLQEQCDQAIHSQKEYFKKYLPEKVA